MSSTMDISNLSSVLTDGVYRGYTLDRFQLEAIGHVEQNCSLLVSAPTGTGKTLIADYVIERCARRGERAIYTAPIKALSNQKYKEFKRLLGEENVGILTGDMVVNADAPIVIMTTEIFRNILHQSPSKLDGVTYTIFDEIHYIDDLDRGSVWEESLIFMPPHMRFVGLSATIPNVMQLADWIESVQKKPVQVVKHYERAVPLTHHLFEKDLGFCTFKQAEKRFLRLARHYGLSESGRLLTDLEPTTHMDLLRQLNRSYLPCLFFTFSRRRCEVYARQLAEEQNFLSDAQRENVYAVIESQLMRYGTSGGHRIKDLTGLLLKGIGYHHAGLLPVAKDIVEELFERKLIYVLYCTETFAVGLNFPCRTVCFDALTKWDGYNFRPLSNREYFQIAGRAGRRGIDREGCVIAMVDMKSFNPDDFPTRRENEVEPLQSRFSLTYNSVLNLTANYAEEEIADILVLNFATYQNEDKRSRLEKAREALMKVRQEFAGCEVMETERCPILYAKKEKRYHELQKRLVKRMAGHQLNGIKSLRRRIAQLDKELVEKAKECPPEVISRCRSRLREYRSAVVQLDRLEKEIKELSPADIYLQEYLEKKALLVALDYIRDGRLTARGEFSARLNGQELMVTELFFRGVFHDWSESELVALAVSLDYEPRKGEGRQVQHAFDDSQVRRLFMLLKQMEETYLGYSTVKFHVQLADAAFRWSEGAKFSELLSDLPVDEGDLVYAFRRAIDILRQVRNAAGDDPFLRAKMQNSIRRVDRNEVSILL